MTQKQAVQLETKVKILSREVVSLRSLLLSFLAEDTEGKYKPSFVKRIQKAALKQPEKKFTTSKAFLADLKQV